MKCPDCSLLGQKSRVFPGFTSVTCMGFFPYYDEEGNFHVHDPNSHTTDYSCTAGHSWRESIKVPCGSCAWPKEVTNG